jgi:hypothetical protein
VLLYSKAVGVGCAHDDAMLLEVCLSLIIILVVRIALTLPYFTRQYRSASRSAVDAKSCKTLIVLGSGGHTAEMLRLVEALTIKRERKISTSDRESKSNYTPRVYVVAETDLLSIALTRRFETQGCCNENEHVGDETACRKKANERSYANSSS